MSKLLYGARNRALITFALMSLLFLFGCASTQLNYNTEDLASTVDTLVTDQVLANLSKFIDSPHAIPSQVTILTGTVTTNNVITPSVTSPLVPAKLVTDTAADVLGGTTTITHAVARTGQIPSSTLSGTDQWTQTWGIAPLLDPDQLRRLRVLYQYGAGQMTDTEFLCNYPIIQKKPDTGDSTVKVEKVTVPIDGTDKTVTVEIGPKEQPPAGTQYQIDCHSGRLTFVKADPAFLNPPGCIICDYTRDPSKPKTNLEVNRHLLNKWLKYAESPSNIPENAKVLGHFGRNYLYVTSQDDLSSFYEFALFVLEATSQSATTATGVSLGKGPASSAPAFITPPSILLQ